MQRSPQFGDPRGLAAQLGDALLGVEPVQLAHRHPQRLRDRGDEGGTRRIPALLDLFDQGSRDERPRGELVLLPPGELAQPRDPRADALRAVTMANLVLNVVPPPPHSTLAFRADPRTRRIPACAPTQRRSGERMRALRAQRSRAGEPAAVHVFPVQDPHRSPEVLVSACGEKFNRDDAEKVPERVGAACSACLLHGFAELARVRHRPRWGATTSRTTPRRRRRRVRTPSLSPGSAWCTWSSTGRRGESGTAAMSSRRRAATSGGDR